MENYRNKRHMKIIQGGEQFYLDFCLQLQLPGGASVGNPWEEGSVSPVGKHATVFRVELYKILACVF